MKIPNKLTWNNISIAQFQKITDAAQGGTSPFTIPAAIFNLSEGDLRKMSITEYKLLMEEATNLLQTKPEPSTEIVTQLLKYKTEKYTYACTLNANQMTVAQFIDWEAVTTKSPNDYVSLLACLFVPKGKTYGDGYSIDDVKEDIGNNMSVPEALGMCFFFTKTYQALLQSTKYYLKKQAARTASQSATDLQNAGDGSRM